jgi:hypothetical protein
VRPEPIITLSLIEDNLESSQAKGHKTEADVVNPGFAKLAAFEIGRILD